MTEGALPENPWPQHGVAAHPKKAPRCWVRSVCVRELWGSPKPGSHMGGGFRCSWRRAAQEVGRQILGAGCQNHDCPGAYLAFPPLGAGLDAVGDGRGGRGRREEDALYPGNTCLMRDARLAPQAGTRTGVPKHRG